MNITIPLKYKKAEAFDEYGYSRVTKNSYKYLIDTFGHEYRIKDNILTLLGSDKEDAALIWNLKRLKELPAKMLKFPNRIKYLALNMNLLKKLPSEIGTLSNLKWLDLSSNDLKQLPESIGDLKNLTYLNISHNKLKALPKTVGNLQNLEYLILTYNKDLETLPSEIGNLKNLKSLQIEMFSKIKEIPPEIGNLENLEELLLNGCKLLKHIPFELGKLKKLKRLYINTYSEIPKEEIIELQKMIPNCFIYDFSL